MSKANVVGFDVVDQVGEVETALHEVADALGGLAGLLEGDAEVDEEIRRGLVAMLRTLSGRCRDTAPILQTIAHIDVAANRRRAGSR